MTETTSRIDRRTVLKTVGLLAVAGAGTGVGFTALSGRASAAITGFRMDGDAITTDDGTLTDVKVRASGTWQFDGLDGRVEGVKIGLSVHRPGSAHAQGYKVVTQKIPVEGNPAAASGNFDLPWTSLPWDTPYFYDLEDFAVPEDGETKSTKIIAYLWMEVHTYGWQTNYATEDIGGPGLPGHGPCRTTNFHVTVTNQKATAQVDGSGEAHAEGVNEHPGEPGDPDDLGLVWSTGECKWRIDNTNPAGTAPVKFTLENYATGESITAYAPADHWGYVGQHDPHGLYFDMSPGTARLFVDGELVDTKARGNCEAD